MKYKTTLLARDINKYNLKLNFLKDELVKYLVLLLHHKYAIKPAQAQSWGLLESVSFIVHLIFLLSSLHWFCKELLMGCISTVHKFDTA